MSGMTCGVCKKPMKAELIWLSNVFIGSRLVPAYHCTTKTCKEHKQYVKDKAKREKAKKK